jgi:hypothetical protein
VVVRIDLYLYGRLLRTVILILGQFQISVAASQLHRVGRLFLNVQYVGDEEIAGTPEGRIVTIVESYYSLLSLGHSAVEAFARIESFRSTAIPSKIPNGGDLDDCVKYRVRLEHKRGRQISDHDIGRAIFITGEFIAEFCVVSDAVEDEITVPIQDKNADYDSSVDLHFMSELPHPNVSPAEAVFKTRGLVLTYYENPRTIGSVVAGTVSAYKCSQAVVISDEDQRPLMIVRSEENESGGRFLCSLDFKGRRENLGQVAAMGRDEFVQRVGKMILKMKYGEKASGDVVLKTL